MAVLCEGTSPDTTAEGRVPAPRTPGPIAPGGDIDLGLAALFRHSPAAAPPLRIGVLLDGEWTIRCFHHVLQDIVGSNFARLSAVVLNESSPDERARRAPKWRRYWNGLANPQSRRTLAFSLYNRFVDRRSDAGDPLAIVPCHDLLDGVPVLRVEPVTRRFVHRFPEPALAELRALDLDVILRFGFNILHGGVLGAARCGVWSYHHGDPEQYRGGPAQFWELAERNPVSGAMLQVLTEELDAGLVLAQGHFPTSRSLSLSANRAAPYWGSQHFVIQKLNEVHRHGWESVRARALPVARYAGRRLPYRSPTNAEFTGWAAREVVRRAAGRLVRTDTSTDWFVGVRRTAVPLPDAAAGPALRDFLFLRNPRGRFLADPFLVPADGRMWLFVEDYGFDDARGVISCGELADDGCVLGLRPCLERPYHLSYPNVFWHDGEAFMIPESERSGTVDLYRAVAFPFRWTKVRTLLKLRCVDPTILRHEGRWWLFVTHTAVPGIGAMTVLFTSRSLHGEWTLHPASPISTDVRNARGAGPVFLHDGAWVRPSQDCARSYGRALVLNVVTRLSTSEYQETSTRRYEPDALVGCDGVHHYHRRGDWEVIDARAQAPMSRFGERPVRDAGGSLACVDVAAVPRLS